jgi:hypothetical protein
MLKDRACSMDRRLLWKAVSKLRHSGFIEEQSLMGWPSYIRLKEKYLKIEEYI